MRQDLTPERLARQAAKAKLDEAYALYLNAHGREREKLNKAMIPLYAEWERTLLAVLDAEGPNPSVKRIIYKGRREEVHGDIPDRSIHHRRRRVVSRKRKHRKRGE